MRIAVPTLDGHFSEHFGRSDGFFIVDVEPSTRHIDRMRTILRTRGRGHCESLPDWLARVGVTTVVVRGIGETGRQNLARLGIEVSLGHAGDDPLELVRAFLAAPAGVQANPCAEFEHRHRHCRVDATRTKRSTRAPREKP